jgi:hypothetical protein
MGVYEKLFSVFQEVGTVLRDLEIPTRDGKYRAVSEASVLGKIRPLLAKHRLLVLTTSAKTVEVGNGLTTVDTEYLVIDVDDGSSCKLASGGQGKSPADKGYGMALTYAEKYLYLKNFKIITGDDPDQTGDYEHQQRDAEEAENAIKKYNFLKNELELLRRGTKLGNEENYNRILKALNKVSTNMEGLLKAEQALKDIKDGVVSPDLVAQPK